MLDRIFLKKYDASVENERFYKGFLAYLKKQQSSDNTIKKYSGDVNEYLEFLKMDNMRATDCYEEDLEEYLFYLWEKGLTVDNIKKKFTSIKSFYGYLFDCGWSKENPTLFLKKSKVRIFETSYQFLTVKQVKKSRTLLRRRAYQSRAVINLILSSGIKMHCIPEIKWEQIDFTNRTIVNVVERPDKVIQVFFDEYTCRTLKRLKEDREEKNIDSEYVFLKKSPKFYTDPEPITCEQIRVYAKSFGEHFGMDNLSPTDLRRTFVNIMLEGGMTKEDISVLLNYKCDKASIVYGQENIERILKIKDSIIY